MTVYYESFITLQAGMGKYCSEISWNMNRIKLLVNSSNKQDIFWTVGSFFPRTKNKVCNVTHPSCPWKIYDRELYQPLYTVSASAFVTTPLSLRSNFLNKFRARLISFGLSISIRSFCKLKAKRISRKWNFIFYLDSVLTNATNTQIYELM